MKKRIMTLAWLVAALFIGFTNQANAQKTEKLFNGKDLKNWNFSVAKDGVSAEEVFSVQNGLIRISGEPFGYMYTKEKYGNYKLHVEWHWPEGKASNSGIFLLIEDLKKPFPNCIECQLHAGDAGDFVLLGGSDLTEFTSKVRPEFPVVKKDKASTENPAGEWNEANIFVQDGVITVYINGVYQNTGTNRVTEGHIGLQSEGGPIEFRNVTVTKL